MRSLGLEQTIRRYSRVDGPYDDDFCGNDVHVSTSPYEIYLEYNKNVPEVGTFIPAGLYETLDEYDERRKVIMELTKDWTLKDAKTLVEKFWIPRTTFRSFQQWVVNQILPRMDLLNPTKTFCDENKTDFIIGYMIDVGWDPFRMWSCSPPNESYEDIRMVANGIWDMLGHSTYGRIKNEYMKLFNTNGHRIIQFIDLVDKSIPKTETIEQFMIQREKKMVAHLVWLAKTDGRIFDHFYKRLMKKANHNIAMSMSLNDPLMSEEERLRRDWMLITQPKKGDYEFRVEGHNKMRDSIVGEYVKPSDYEEARDGMFEHYFREENKYMDDYLLMKYAYFIDHPNEMEDVDTLCGDLPDKVVGIIHEKYGKFDNEILASVISIANNTFQKDIRKARWTEKDAVKHVLEIVRDMYPAVCRLQLKVDTEHGEDVVRNSDLNIIGAFRVIMTNPDAKEEFFRISRIFGSQDPRHNPKICEMLTELATNVMNQTKVRSKFRKDPQSILLRKEQPRNPKSRVTDYFDRFVAANEEFGNDKFDLVINGDSDRGHELSKSLTHAQEKKIAHDREAKRVELRRQLMRKTGTSGLNDAMERYLGTVETKKVDYSGRNPRDADLAKKRKETKSMKELLAELDIHQDESVDLGTASVDDLEEIVNTIFTDKGQQYILDVIDKFDRESKSEYDETEEKKMLKDRLETIRSNIEEIIGSGDPLYIKNGKGEPGSFTPEDTMLTKEDVVEMLEWMTQDELIDFIDKKLDQNSRDELIDFISEGNTMEDVRQVLIRNAELFADVPDDDPQEAYSKKDQTEFLTHLWEMIQDLDNSSLIQFIHDFLDEKDKELYLNYIRKGMTAYEIKRRIIKLLISEYDICYMMDVILGADDDGLPVDDEIERLILGRMENEDVDSDDTGIHFDSIFKSGVPDTTISRNDVMQSLIKRAPEISSNSLEQDKNDFYRWMVSNFNVNEADLNDVLDRLDRRGFEDFRANILNAYKSGKIRPIGKFEPEPREEEEAIDFGSLRDDVKKWRNLKLSSREDDEDDDDDDISEADAYQRINNLVRRL